MPISIKDIPLFKGLTPAELRSIQGCLQEKTYRKGEALFVEGADCRRVFFVRSGSIKLYRIGPSGREQTLQVLQEGDSCACNPGASEWICSCSAEALESSALWFLSTIDYGRLLKKTPALAHALNRLFAGRLRSFSALIEEVSLKDSRSRLVKFLLDLAEESRTPPGKDLPMPYTREDLARRIGTTRETVERQLSQLKNRGLLTMDRKKIAIRDKQALQKLL